MTKFKTGLVALLTLTAVITTAIPLASAETTGSNKPPYREEMAQKIADLLGIDVETLKTEREAGKKLMEIAEEYGASDEVMQQLKDMRKQMHGNKNNSHKPRFSKAALEKIATAMGISTADLIAQLKDGAKLKDLAEQYGVDLKEFAPKNNQYNALVSEAVVN